MDPAKKELSLKKTLWKLAYAKRATCHVLTTCDYYERHVVNETHPMHIPLICSICVTYCRPFTDNDGVGMVSSTLARHSDPKLQHTHDILWASRMHFYAHMDSTLTSVSPDGASEPLQQLQVIVSRRKTAQGDELSFGIAVSEIRLRCIVIPDVRELCQALDQRLDRELNSTMQQLFSSRGPEFVGAMDQAQADEIAVPIDVHQ